MYKKLNEKEIQKFTRKYLPIWKNDIKEVSCVSFRFVKNYLVNRHYFVIVKPFRIIEKDLLEE